MINSILKKVVLALMSGLTTFICVGQNISWEPMHAPVIESISTIVQFREGTTIVGTSNNGIYRSNGQNWESINDGLNSLIILDLVATPNGPVFAGTVEGIYQLSEINDVWIYKETGESVACFSSNAEGDVFAGGRGKIIRSNDQGQTWMSYRIEDAPEYLQIESLEVTSQGAIFATVPEILNTYRSTDNGDSWQIVRSGDGVTSLSSNSQGHIYAAIDGVGIESSKDNGETWEKVSDQFDGIRQARIIIDQSDQMYVGDNYGNLFHMNLETYDIFCISNQIKPGQVNALHWNDLNEIYIGTEDSGIFKTDDMGQNWSQVNAGLRLGITHFLWSDNNNNIFAGSYPKGLNKYNPGNELWSFLSYGGSSNYQFMTNSKNQLFISFVSGFYASAGLIRSNDQGETWEDIGQTLPGYPMGIPIINDLASDNDDFLYALLSSGEIYKSVDDGDNWIKIDNNMGNSIDLFCLYLSSDGNMFAGSHDGTVYRSLDQGVNWNAISTGMSHDVKEIIPDHHGGIYLLNSFGDQLAYSQDQGITWIFIDVDRVGALISCIVCDENDCLFISTIGKGVFLSFDQGQNWRAINQNLPELEVIALTQADDNYLYCSTLSHGIFRTDTPVITGIDDNRFPYNTSRDVIECIYPNPVRDHAAVRFSLKQSSQARMTIYNSIGEIQLEVINEFKSQGSYEEEIDLNKMKNGIYFVKLETQNEILFKMIMVMH